ncbi:WD repeat-containing protein 55 homolog [Bacillus rossius redtenbacheri]|uniref:WD repeat-containing protein 55 homolog n=1 Tax=Bacillus rossius redtenbacheri TaxID=93214 RepID=UPI002FDD59E6
MIDKERHDSSSRDSDSEDDDGVSVSESDSESGGEQGAPAARRDEEEEEEGDEEEDELVKAIRREKEKPREHPPDIRCEEFVVDISFHPEQDLIAAATVMGDVLVYKYAVDSTELTATWELHTKSCRDIEFSADGSLLFSSSKDRSVMVTDASTGKLVRAYDDAHEAGVYSLLVVDRNMFTSGDEAGTVKLWDLRKPGAVFSLKEMDDYVSKMVTTDSRRHVVCSSGEGTLTSINLSSRKLHMQSEMYDAELTSLALLRSDTKVVVSSSKGTLFLFNWGEFGLHNDEFPGNKRSINALIPISDNIVVEACEDGVLRATHMFPHRHLGVVGQHQFSVECLDISGDGTYVASSSHDQLIKFWNIKYFEDIEVNPKEKSKKQVEMRHNLPSSKAKNAQDFFSGLA